MTYQEPDVSFPPPEFVRRGPPTSVRDMDRQDKEKWGRVVVVHPRTEETADGVRHDFVKKGPFTLPLAVRREGVDLGSKEAWAFFTHPYTVFPEDATFYNVEGKGCLGARLFVRGQEGVRLYDEVGANLGGSETVVDTFQGALGVLRHRVLGEGNLGDPLAADLLATDIDLLQVFHLFTYLLRTSAPLKTLRELYGLFSKPTLHNFAWELFSERERDLMRALQAGGENEGHEELKRSPIRFRVDRDDFTRITDVQDAQGTQAILGLLSEWEAFQEAHRDRMAELAVGIQEQEAVLAAIKQEVRTLQKEPERRGLTALFARNKVKAINELKAKAVVAIRAKRALEAAFDEIPGYERMKGLSDRVKGFEATVESVYGLARDMGDHNVDRADVSALRTLVLDRVLGEDEDEAKKALRAYDLRLRAELLPKVLRTHDLSAYLLRRPDALRGKVSRRNIARVNTLARFLIEYFRSVRYGSKSTFGEEFDATWGQVIGLEGQI